MDVIVVTPLQTIKQTQPPSEKSINGQDCLPHPIE